MEYGEALAADTGRSQSDCAGLQPAPGIAEGDAAGVIGIRNEWVSGRRNTMQIDNPKIVSVEEMRAERDKLVAQGKQLVFTNGCFDILHRGHVTYLTFARNQGDALVVGLNTDASVRANKGDDRPINSEQDRAFVLGSLRAVDFVVLFGDKEPKEIIAKILPQVLVKGSDWAHYVSGREVVEANGGRVVLAEMVEGRSTTNTIQRILRAHAKEETE
jgi:rfaE bifunctional protein nucleotidyltransferase chain/domain